MVAHDQVDNQSRLLEFGHKESIYGAMNLVI
jgi:hypothetical protein